MIDVLAYVKGRKKQTSSGWVSFNAVCCIHNGQNADRRGRGGLKVSEQGWSYHCFNCNYTASFILGRNISLKARRLLSWLGVPEDEISRANLESLRHRSMEGILTDRQRVFNQVANLEFEERDLPPFAELVPAEGVVRDYVRSRAIPDNYPMMTQLENDGVHWTRPHIIVPFTYYDQIVGYSCRFLDNKQPRFISDSQPGYVFGIDSQPSNWQSAILVEGVLDAVSINGLAALHSTVSDQQVRLIRSLSREIIVVPDRDTAGMELVDRAVELGWAVSMPDWAEGVKDVNDAVQHYGRLTTVLMIMQARETSKIKIELRRKRWLKTDA
jgi:hypothetical protein